MKYRKIFAVGCLICGVLLSGCRGESQKTGQEELTAEEKNPKNGSQITIQLTEDVKLDAQIQMPETGTDSIKEYRVEVDGFDGEEVIPKILGAMPDSGLRTQESSLPDPTYLYHGPLGPEWNNTDGSVIVSSHVTVQTSHWDKIDPFISVSQIGAEVSVNEKDVSEFQEELGFSGREEAAERVSEFVKSITGYEDVRCTEEYSISYQGRKLSIVTDTGHISDDIFEEIKDSNLIVLESNHEINVLKMCKYPYQIKMRILGDHGHLSNTAAADCLLCLFLFLFHFHHLNRLLRCQSLSMKAQRMTAAARLQRLLHPLVGAIHHTGANGQAANGQAAHHT